MKDGDVSDAMEEDSEFVLDLSQVLNKKRSDSERGRKTTSERQRHIDREKVRSRERDITTDDNQR